MTTRLRPLNGGRVMENNIMARGGFISSNGGYIGHSMSKRAASAYSSGYMPKSKWTKTEIMERIDDWLWDETLDRASMSTMLEEFKKISRDKLFNAFVVYREWHHVGGFAKPVDFYEFKDSRLPDYIKENKDLLQFTYQYLYGSQD